MRGRKRFRHEGVSREQLGFITRLLLERDGRNGAGSQVGRLKIKESVNPVNPDDLVNLKAWFIKIPTLRKRMLDVYLSYYYLLLLKLYPLAFEGYNSYNRIALYRYRVVSYYLRYRGILPP
jgi:hypothetical protein